MIIIDNYSIPIYILLNFHHSIKNEILDKTFFKNNSLIFLLASWYKTDKVVRIVNLNSEFNIIVLANSPEEKIFFESKINTDVLFCNQNTFLNENNFTISNQLTKKYDMVIDSAFHKYKNVKLASKISNTIHIGYYKYRSNETDGIVVPDYGILANFNNGIYERLNRNQINIIYNQACIGGIFSECEGACFASSQYLLSGLPVISIKSVGSRDVWYNEYNSIICDKNEDSVYEAVDIVKKKLLNGEFNREKIRELHLKQMDEYRNTIIEYINSKLIAFGESVNVNDIKKQFAYF
jgi:hypothetical protein